MYNRGKYQAMLGPSFKSSKKDEISLMLHSKQLADDQPDETDPILGEPLFMSAKHGGRFKL